MAKTQNSRIAFADELSLVRRPAPYIARTEGYPDFGDRMVVCDAFTYHLFTVNVFMPQPALPHAPWLRHELRPAPDEVESLAWIVWAYERRPIDDFEHCRREVEIHLWASRCVDVGADAAGKPAGFRPAKA